MCAELSSLERAAAEDFVKAVMFKPWRPHATGPGAYDCWGLARAAQRTLAGIELPVIGADPGDVRAIVREIETSPLRAEWLDVETPGHLDLVRMSHSRRPHHIGVYLALDGGGILHAAQQFDADGAWAPWKPAVAFTALATLPLEGWAVLAYMRHDGRVK